MSATGTILNEYTPLTATAAVNATTLTVGNSALNANGRFAADLAAGDLLLVVQPQGATISAADDATYGTVAALNNAGRYQLIEVAAVPSGTSIALTCRLFSSFTTGGHAQVVRVPRYTTLDLDAGAAVTAPAWDGSTGGIVAIETTGAVTLASGAAIDVTALGFRGGALEQDADNPPTTDFGYRSPSSFFGAEKGEGIAGNATDYDNLNGRYGRGAPANGGGGGNAHNASGGGGANAAVLNTTYTGKGNPDRGAGNIYDAAWNLESANFATSTSSGGGRGGYSYSNSNQNALTLGPNQPNWGGDLRQDKGGLGGRPVASSGRAFFGGGGGAGDSNNGNGTAGAAGGGFIYLIAGGPVSGGSLVADGGAVTDASRNDGSGGGGGGGSVVVNAASAVSSTLLARGGEGGPQNPNGSDEADGPGGGGGGGYVAYTLGVPGSDVSGGQNGLNTTQAMTEFPPDGGTRGAAGRVEGSACSALLCPAIVADVATSLSFATNPLPPNQAASVSVIFVNNGPDAAADVVRLVQLPPGLGVGAVTVTTATGSGSYDNTTGQVTFTVLPSLASGADANATLSFTPPPTGNVVVSSIISTITDEYCQVGDDNSGNNTLIIILPADVSVTLSGPATAAAGSTITYTATVQNVSTGTGTSDATDVVLNVQLPKALLNPVLPAGTTYDFNSGLTTLTVGQVNRGAPAVSYAFTFNLPSNTQPVAGIASATAFQIDPDPSNNDGVASGMRVATTVALPLGTGTCTGTTFDNVSAATQGLYAEYFKGYFNNALTYFDAPAVPDLVRTEGTVDYTADNSWGDLSSAINSGTDSDPDEFSARYRGYLTVSTAGYYTFSLLSDDIAYLWLDNAARTSPLVAANTVVQDAFPHSPRVATGTPVYLAAGPHPLLALYGENGGFNRFQISYSGADTGDITVVIPQSVLCDRQFSGPLPVELTAFTAEAEKREALLVWRTASELRNDHFDVERSRDGSVFKKIGEVSGFGTSTTAHDYTFADAAAATAGGGLVYYRLRQVDTNGASQYSPVRTLNFKAGPAGEAGFHLYPNPAQHEVTLELVGLGDAAPKTFTITDLAGRVVLRKIVERGAENPTFDLGVLPEGVYQVQVEQQGQRFTQRLVHTTN
ncbi:T9SS type A sorting domain-containing protein [Hymenobacter terricola]|uniref:T9SS type A sorting domain-containing protein n=1 Tax=Hymenobacter terricola TaxID=2819236 RepID=UPI001CF1101C|nr:T9SS type A sorting domain-containing protein [Hymenobacter terricola]